MLITLILSTLLIPIVFAANEVTIKSIELIEQSDNTVELSKMIKNNSQRFYDSSEIKTAEENIKEVLKLRSKSVLSQIDKSGEIYSSSIDLRTMGGLDFLK